MAKNTWNSSIKMPNGWQIIMPWQAPIRQNTWESWAEWNANYLASQIKPNPEQPNNYNIDEWTIGGYNYWLDRATRTSNNQQASYNALNWTGHVAWLPQQQMVSVQRPQQVQEQTSTNVLPEWPMSKPWDVVENSVQETTVETTTPTTPTPAPSRSTSSTSRWTTSTAQQTWWSRFRNANVNFEQYWDDSSPDKQAQAWGMNEKYTWEWVKTSNLAYDPNITTADLDPNYVYWMDAQYANSDNAWYIARRNDMIASALYNEAIAQWRNPTKEDVINFLASQKNWNNSTEADRFNTIESIWKRLWGIAQQNPVQWPDLSNEQPTYSDAALNNMEKDLNKSTAWDLYGKVTADQSTHIQTLEDENSVYKSMNESRIQTYKQLRWMDSQAIAASIVSWAMAMDSQSMRDLMQYDPAKYEYVQQAIKQLRGQMNINTISSGEWEWNTTATNWQSGISNEITDFALNSSNWATSTADILKSVNSTLNSNQSAATASEQMATIEADMANLQNRMKNLKKEASTVFKWDVPQYIVNAYISNRTAEIQDQLSILENRYNAAYSRYQKEWEQTKRAAEFDLKKQELEIKKQNANLDEWNTRQGVALKWAELGAKYPWWSTTTPWWVQVPTTALSQEQIWYVVDSLVDQCINWQLPKAQCAAWVQKNYFSQIWIEIWNLSSWERKKAICTDLASSGYIPKKWDVVALDTGASYTDSNWNKVTAWHMWIVVWVEWDTLKYLDWNGSVKNWVWTETAAIRTKKLNDKSIYWYYNPSKWTQWTSIGGQIWWNWTRRDWETFNLDNAPTYNSLSYDQQNTVKWLLNLSINPATITKRQYWDDFEKILSAVTEINPNWQAADFWQADKVKKEWNTSTKNGSNSRNGTAIATAKELYEMADILWNTKFTDWNSMMNSFKKKLSNEDFIRFRVKLWTLASEYAWALKGNNAAPTEKEIEEARQQIAENLSGWGIKAAAIEMTKSLYNKNANEADNYKNVTLEKPNLVVTKDVADWMYNTAWIITLPEYYNYTPAWWWGVVAQSNNWWFSNSAYNPQMTQNLFSY